jgi:hypothetical protein
MKFKINFIMNENEPLNRFKRNIICNNEYINFTTYSLIIHITVDKQCILYLTKISLRLSTWHNWLLSHLLKIQRKFQSRIFSNYVHCLNFFCFIFVRAFRLISKYKWDIYIEAYVKKHFWMFISCLCLSSISSL